MIFYSFDSFKIYKELFFSKGATALYRSKCTIDNSISFRDFVDYVFKKTSSIKEKHAASSIILALILPLLLPKFLGSNKIDTFCW